MRIGKGSSGTSTSECGSFKGQGQPVVSVDTKKKDNLGLYRNGGREWRPEGQPEEVNVYDFPDAERGKAIPYGVYDVAANAGWVSVGWTMTRRNLRWRHCGAGGARWGGQRIRRRSGY